MSDTPTLRSLQRYGSHDRSCPKPGNYPVGAPFRECTCGFDAALEAAAPASEPHCNHWPGQPRCEVCGMGASEPRTPTPDAGEIAKALEPHGNWDYTGSPSLITCDCGWSTPMPGGPVSEDIRVWREHIADAILAALAAQPDSAAGGR